MTYKNSVKKCNEMLALARAGSIVWWRREGFHQEPFRDTAPKWHVLTGRLTHLNDPGMQPEDHPVWVALCKYRKSFDERHFEIFPKLRKSAPKKDTRCRACLAELPGHLQQLAANNTAAQNTDQPSKEDAPL